VLEELPADLAPGRPDGVRAAARRSIEADLRRYLEHEAADDCDWAPRAVELRFGFEEEAVAPLELGDGVRLRGVIDRVDVAPGGTAAGGRAYAVPGDLLAGRVQVPGDLPDHMIECPPNDAIVAREWTDEQRLAIERREGDLLLAAGAGSGKTSVLVERFVRA